MDGTRPTYLTSLAKETSTSLSTGDFGSLSTLFLLNKMTVMDYMDIHCEMILLAPLADYVQSSLCALS